MPPSSPNGAGGLDPHRKIDDACTSSLASDQHDSNVGELNTRLMQVQISFKPSHTTNAWDMDKASFAYGRRGHRIVKNMQRIQVQRIAGRLCL